MTRPIKFRAWDKGAEKWRVITSLDWYKPITGKNGLCGVIIVTESGHDQFMPIEDVEIVEGTGLTDKNGKEIYEGDVVFSKELNANVEVRYGNAHYFLFGGSAGKPLLSTDENEVIGNIYENPELLTTPSV